MAITYSAYSVYWYDANKDGYGMAGRIRDNGSDVTAFPGMRAGLNGDPKVEGFVDAGGNLRVAVTDRDAAGGLRPVYIHNAVSGAEVAGKSPQSWPENNLYTLVKLGDYLYAIDYDNAKVIEIDANTYAATNVSYTLESKFIPAGYQAVGQALIVIDDILYGLFSFPDSTWSNYAPSLLVRFTVVPNTSITVAHGSLDPEATETDYNTNIAPNAFSLAAYGSDLYIAALGGQQTKDNYNADSRLQRIAYGATNLKNEAIYNLLVPDATNLPYEIRDISFDDTASPGTAYVLVGSYKPTGPAPTDPWKMEGKLMSTTDIANFAFTNLVTIDDFTGGVLGYYWSAKYTSDNVRLWYTRGNDIRVYDASNLPTIVGTLPMSTLNGGGAYTALNDLTYVGKLGTIKLSGYRSHIQRSNSKFAQAARALTKGRPELTEEEFAQLAAIYGAP
jgi:hypothetical protein